jgi:hypothetical protein
MTWLTVMEYLCHKWPRICSTCRKHFPVLSSFYKTKDRVTRTPLKTGGERRGSGRVSSSCSTSDTRRVNLFTNPVTSQERRKDERTGKCLRQVEHIRGHLWHRYSITVNQVMEGHMWVTLCHEYIMMRLILFCFFFGQSDFSQHTNQFSNTVTVSQTLNILESTW